METRARGRNEARHQGRKASVTSERIRTNQYRLLPLHLELLLVYGAHGYPLYTHTKPCVSSFPH